MFTTTHLPTPITAPQNRYERVALGNQLFREYHSRCFWHCPRDLVITEELIPFVIKGLRTHGGRRGFMLAALLHPNGDSPCTLDRELLECR
jgi:hypothetical protein